MWWWSTLTQYFLRIRGALASHLQHKLEVATQSCSKCLACSASASGESGREHLPSCFDFGVHIRIGDACGPRAPPTTARGIGQKLRVCVKSLSQALGILRNTSKLRLAITCDIFLATDSEEIIRQARDQTDPQFRVHYLALNRAKYDGDGRIEHRSARAHNQLAILTDALLETMFLAHSRVIAGGLFGNVARLAMQLQPSPSAYISLDGYMWCVDSRCTSRVSSNARLQDMCGGRSRGCVTQPAARHWDKYHGSSKNRTT